MRCFLTLLFFVGFVPILFFYITKCVPLLQRIKHIDTPISDETTRCDHQMKNIHHPPVMEVRESEIKRRRLLGVWNLACRGHHFRTGSMNRDELRPEPVCRATGIRACNSNGATKRVITIWGILLANTSFRWVVYLKTSWSFRLSRCVGSWITSPCRVIRLRSVYLRNRCSIPGKCKTFNSYPKCPDWYCALPVPY